MKQFRRIKPRRARLIFKSGHVEVIEIRDDVDVTWTTKDGHITELNIPRVEGYQGAFVDIDEIAALFVLSKEEE